jgi:hypothetical protein
VMVVVEAASNIELERVSMVTKFHLPKRFPHRRSSSKRAEASRI